jgi:hypothetical protein
VSHTGPPSAPAASISASAAAVNLINGIRDILGSLTITASVQRPDRHGRVENGVACSAPSSGRTLHRRARSWTRRLRDWQPVNVQRGARRAECCRTSIHWAPVCREAGSASIEGDLRREATMPTELFMLESGPIEYRLDRRGPDVLLVMYGGHMRAGLALGEDAFAAAGFTVLAPSRPGYGRSPLAAAAVTSACHPVRRRVRSGWTLW